MTEAYDDWDDSLDEDQKSSRKPGGKKFGLLHIFTEAPVKIHLSEPEEPYLHPKTGQRLPFRVGSNHFVPGAGKKGNGAFLECGINFDEPCVIHAYSDPVAFGLDNVAADARLAKLDAKNYYGIAGWIEEWYHLVEYYKDDSDEAQGTYNRRERCAGRGCEHCEDGWLKVFGKKMYTEVSPGQYRFAFADLNRRIQNSHCKCGGEIFVPSFHCEACDNLVLDVAIHCDCGADEGSVGINLDNGMATCDSCEAEWSARYYEHEKLFRSTGDRHKCKDCGHQGRLRPNRICTTENCEVDPYGIFDCQLTVRVTGEGRDKRTTIDNYEIQPPDERLFALEHQGGDEWAPKIVDSHKKPIDLNWLLQPASTAEQAKVLGKPDPFTATGRGASRFSRYSAEGAEGEQEETQ